MKTKKVVNNLEKHEKLQYFKILNLWNFKIVCFLKSNQDYNINKFQKWELFDYLFKIFVLLNDIRLK